MATPPAPFPLVAVLDARRGEVYVQRFTADRSPDGPPHAATPADAAAEVEARSWLVGTGGPLLMPHFEPGLVAGQAAIAPDAGGVARAAAAHLGRGVVPISGFQLTPVYLREPDARPMTTVRIPGAEAAHPGGP